MIFTLKLISVFVGDRQMSFCSLRIASRYVLPLTTKSLPLFFSRHLNHTTKQHFYLFGGSTISLFSLFSKVASPAPACSSPLSASSFILPFLVISLYYTILLPLNYLSWTFFYDYPIPPLSSLVAFPPTLPPLPPPSFLSI